MTGLDRPAVVGDAIVVDEVGLEIGVFGKYRLRSFYQPIFARQGPLLAPVAVEVSIRPYRHGAPVPWRDFFADVGEDDRHFIESMCRDLHLRNFPNIGAGRLDLFLRFDPGASRDPDKALGDIRLLARRLDAIGLDPGKLVCHITGASAIGADTLFRIGEAVRSHGIRIAIDDRDAMDPTGNPVDLIAPDIVKVDGTWLGKLSREAAVMRLLMTVVAGMKARGAQVLVEGVEDASRLRCGIDAGADLFQGSHLAPSALVGTVFREDPLDIAEKLGEAPKVTRLFRQT